MTQSLQFNHPESRLLPIQVTAAYAARLGLLPSIALTALLALV
jgi:hypothetical protein